MFTLFYTPGPSRVNSSCLKPPRQRRAICTGDKRLSSREVTAGDPDEHPAGRAKTAQPSLPQSLAPLGVCPESSNCQITIRRLQGKRL